MNYQTIKTLTAKVCDILENNPETRNSDVSLTITVWQRYYSHLLIDSSKVELAKLFELPREDFIGRVRRKLQESGRYLPTKEHIAKARGINMDEWRVAMGYPTKATSGTAQPSWVPPSEKPTNRVVTVENNQSSLF